MSIAADIAEGLLSSLNREAPLDARRRLYVRAMQAYHGSDSPIMSDAEFDDLKRSIREESPKDPVLQLVGAPINASHHLRKAKHEIHMGSVANSDQHGPDYDAGLLKWWEKMGRVAVVGSLKVDGLSVALMYRGGRFVQAITRGDGAYGEDVTANMIHMKGLPFLTHPNFFGWVRGEIVLETQDWEIIKQTSDAKTARNLAAGITRRKDSTGPGQASDLTFVAHDLLSDNPIQSFSTRFNELTRLGFKVPVHRRISTEQDLKKWTLFIAGVREKMPYEIDGIVFTVDDLTIRDHLGIDGEACYRGQVAWKFPASEGETGLREVTWHTGHTGAIHPVAVLNPVVVGGVTVTSASLCNLDEIKRLNLHIGDAVAVSRRGDVIPKVERVVKHYHGESVKAPTECPVCKGSVGKKTNTSGEDSVHLFCLNDECDAKSTGKLRRWIKSLDIQGVGDEVLESLLTITETNTVSGEEREVPFLRSVADLYRLRSLHENGGNLSGLLVNGKKLGKSRVDKILAEIDESRTLTIDQFLGSLGIPHLGKRRVQLIREACYANVGAEDLDSVDVWLGHGTSSNSASEKSHSYLIAHADALGIPGIAQEIQAGLDAKADLVKELLKQITLTVPEAKVEAAADAKLKDQTFCFTGVRASKEELAKLEALGGVEKSGVSKDLKYLVVKDSSSTSSKTVKARELGVDVITYDQFKAMIA